MKHIVSYETSKKLEDAGLEKPKRKQISQFWYTPKGRIYHITQLSGNDIFVRWHEALVGLAKDLYLKMNIMIGFTLLLPPICWSN